LDKCADIKSGYITRKVRNNKKNEEALNSQEKVSEFVTAVKTSF